MQHMHTVFGVSCLNIVARRFACNGDDIIRHDVSDTCFNICFSKLPIPLKKYPTYGSRPTNGSNVTPTPMKLKTNSVSKEKPYLWLATNQPIPNLGVKVKMDGA